MRILKLAACAGVLSWGMALVGAQRGAGGATLFEGARVVVGDGSAPIESGALLVENGQILKVGKKGEVRPPAGATRVDLTGKTIIPALVNVHAHPGYELLTSHGYVFAAPENYTPENLDHLEREAFYGIVPSTMAAPPRWPSRSNSRSTMSPGSFDRTRSSC